MLKAVIVCILAVGIFPIVSASSGADYYDTNISNEPSEADLTTTVRISTEQAEEDDGANKDTTEILKKSNDFIDTTSTKIPLPVRAEEEDENVLPGQSDVTCGALPEIEGAVAPVLEGTKHNIGTTASYTCHFGYTSRISGGFFSRCKIDEQTGEAVWTNPDVSCVSRSCGDPGYVINARRIGNRFTFPNKVEFDCEKGYKLRGGNVRYCQANGEWSGRLPTCEPVYCSPPPDLENGRVQFSSLEYGTELQYTCNKGFVLKNHQLRICASDGKWSNSEPECIETRCKIPESPERGSVQLLGEPKVGSLAIYSCDDDTSLFGTSTSKCMSSGEWTFDAPKCMRYCEIIDIKDGEIGQYKAIQVSRYRVTKQFTKIDERVKHNETVTLRCKTGFTPANRSIISVDGSDEVLCNDGVWTKPMQCQTTSCLGDPPPIENGVPVVEARHHGMIIWYRCNPEARKAKSGKVFCDYGTWKGNTPVCVTTSCYADKLNYPGLLKPRENVYTSGASFTITCEMGYRKLTSKQIIKCSHGEWNIRDNPCIEETCDDDPPSIMNGKPLNFTRDPGSVVHYKCDEHFNLTGTSTVRCEGIKWEGEPPLCKESVKMTRTASEIESERTSSRQTSSTSKPLDITPAPLEEGTCTCAYYYTTDLVTATVNNTKLEPGDKIERNQVVSFSCLQPNMILVWPNGFRLFGVVNITCNTCETLQYHEVPTCETQQSGDTAIAYSEKMKILPGGIIEFKKKEDIRIRCMSVWSQPIWHHDNKKDVYVAKDPPTTFTRTGIYSSYMYIDAVDYDDIGRYECYTENSGKYYRSTKVDLQIAEPDIIRCPELETNTRKGIFNIVYENDRKVNSEAYYNCKDSTQELIGANNRRCLETGKWSGSFPSCSDITCLKFSTYNGLVVSYTNDTKVNSIARFRCSRHGTILVGSNSSLCQYNGTWSNTKPNCEMLDIRCPVVDGKGIFDIFYSNDRKINSTAQFFCRAPDQKVDGCNFMTCQQNGEWFGNYPTCIDYITCARFENALGVFEVSYSDGVRVGSKASFRCSYPYTLKGVSSTTCRYDGMWSNPPPLCEAPKCSIDTLMSNAPEGVILDEKEITGEFVQYGTELRLLCEDDLVLLGSSKATCEGEGKWKYGNVQCVPGCRLMNTDISPHLQIEPQLEYYLFGDFVLLSCPPGQKLSTEIERIMCLGKSWSDPFPDCIEIKETTPQSAKETTRKFASRFR